MVELLPGWWVEPGLTIHEVRLQGRKLTVRISAYASMTTHAHTYKFCDESRAREWAQRLIRGE